MSEIKPCPFGCPPEIDEDVRSPHLVFNYLGPSPLQQYSGPYTKSHRVVCAVCGCRGPEFIEKNWEREAAEAKAIELWNRRGDEELTHERDETLAALAEETKLDQGQFEAFGRLVWDAISKRYADYNTIDGDEECADLAMKCGLCTREPYDQERHGFVNDAEPGDLIYVWGER